MKDDEKISQAVDLAFDYGQTDGSHHKMWVIDQMLRILLGDEDYRTRIELWCEPEDDSYEWDEGIAP